MGSTYQVEVFGRCPGEQSGKPDIIAELRPDKGSWVFFNFIYPGQGNLMAILKTLQEDRQKGSNK